MNHTKRALLNVVFLLASLGVNSLGALGYINGWSQKAVSDRYLSLITPAPMTFSIWGLIYGLVLISLITFLVKANQPYYQAAAERISNLFIATCLLNMAWIVSFSMLWLELSVGLILAYVIVLSLICRRLYLIHQAKRWLLPLTFGLYTGWLVIATVANVTVALIKNNWSGWGVSSESWALIMLIVAVALVGLLLIRLKNAALALPVAWAYWGIYQFLVSPQGWQGRYPMLETTALIGLAGLLVFATLRFWCNRLAVLPRPEEVN